ncbi:hypothetical protein QTP88_016898 [Uroleucon formosanum]
MYLPVFLTLILSSVTKLTNCNKHPVIGILTQEVYWSSFKNVVPLNNSYIAASYVKAGADRPIGIPGKSWDVVKKVNGILVPGGKCVFNVSFGISQSTSKIFHIAKNINDDRDHFPILGICLGFELLLIVSIDGKNPLTPCDSNDMNLPLNLIPTMEENSVLFKRMPENVRNILLTEPVTANHHM